jgi:hypothetical protein
MAEDLTLTGMIRSVVQSELRYLRHYIGQVSDNQDPNTKGRVRVKINDLGWDTDDKAPWCWPRQLHAMDVPKVDEWVEVYFINGDRTRAVYLGQASEILEQIPEGYSDPGKRVLFQDPDSGDSLQYDGSNFELDASEIHLNGTGKHLVNWEDLNTALSSFKTSVDTAISGAITGHTHVITTAPGTSAPGVGAAPATSLDISSSKTNTLKTDG